MSNNSLKISVHLGAKSSFRGQVNGLVNGQLTGMAKWGWKLRSSGNGGKRNFAMAFWGARQLLMANKELTLYTYLNLLLEEKITIPLTSYR